MPFQVSLCVAQNPINAIQLSVPNSYMSPCVTSLTLTATVISGITAGHTFLWEVTSGNQVVFTTPADQLVATVLLTSATDRVFTFWVDKNTSIQQRFDYKYYATATDTTNVSGNNVLQSIASDITNGSPSAASIYGTYILSDVSIASSVINPTSVLLKWDLPINNTNLTQITVEMVTSSGWTVLATLAPTDAQQYIATQNTYYRIKTTHLINHIYYSQYSNVYHLYINYTDYTAYCDSQMVHNGGGNACGVDVVNFTLLSTDSITSELQDNIIPGFGSNSTSQISVVNYTLLSSDSVTSELQDTIPVGFGANNLTSTVTYFGGVVVGG